jgi:hypothetical protein
MPQNFVSCEREQESRRGRRCLPKRHRWMPQAGHVTRSGRVPGRVSRAAAQDDHVVQPEHPPGRSQRALQCAQSRFGERRRELAKVQPA